MTSSRHLIHSFLRRGIIQQAIEPAAACVPVDVARDA